jgi:hypothetical protein
VLKKINELTDPVYLDDLKMLSGDEISISSDEGVDDVSQKKKKRTRKTKKKMRMDKEKMFKKDPGSVAHAEKGPIKLPRSQFTELHGIVGECLKFGLIDESQLAKTRAVLHINGKFSIKDVEGDGNCQFHSILEQLDITESDNFTVKDLRHQIVHFMASNPEAIFLSQAEQIRALYGVRDQDTPGPFSLHSYLVYMLEDKSWGDQITLMAVAMMWGLRLSILNTEGWYTLTFRHHKRLEHSDIVLVFNGVNHYCPAGQY